MLKKFLGSLVFVCAIGAVAQTPSCSNLTLGTNGAFNGYVPSPNDAWHLDVTNAAVDPKSATILTNTADLGGSTLHPTFGSPAAGGYGIPYVVVDSSTTPAVPLPITLYGGDSDIMYNPIPSGLPVEENPVQCVTDGQDRHAIIIDRKQCVAYEMYQAVQCKGGWSASSSAVWDLASTEQRPYGFTSVDAAGLSVFAGLVRYDEIVAGVINHAIRFTARHTLNNANHGYFVYPASHAAGTSSTTNNIIGMRIRLKANFDISGYSTTNQIILKAMKQYGMILADNGSNLYFQGTEDSRWNDSDLQKLRAVPASAFDVIKMGTPYDSKSAPKGAAPNITSFTASATTVPSGASVTLTPTVTGASYSYIDKVGFVRGPMTVSPTATTTYTLTSRNAHGSDSAAVTVTVSGTGNAPTLGINTIATQTAGVAPFAVTSTSNSTGAITYSVVSGPATIAGNIVTVTGAGTVTIKASQAAAGTYTAGSATTSFTVSPGGALLAFVAIPAQTYPTAPFTVSTTTKSSGSIAYAVASGPATISGNTVAVTGTGTVTLRASQAAAGNYAAATATTSFTVGQGSASALTFGPFADQPFGATVALSASSPSPGPITYSVVSGPVVVAGNVLTATGTGKVIVQASQAASGSYPAARVQATFHIVAAVPTLTLATISAKSLSGSAPFAISALSQSKGTISYSVVAGPATVSGNVVTLTGVGAVTVRARQAPTTTFTQTDVAATFNVTP